MQQTATFKQYLGKKIEHRCDDCPNHQAVFFNGYLLHWYWNCRIYNDYDYSTRNLLGCIRLLMELDIDPNSQDETGNTLLHHICSNKYLDIYSCCDKYVLLGEKSQVDIDLLEISYRVGAAIDHQLS